MVHQLDVKNAFLHGDLSETMYMHQPPRQWTDTGYQLLYVDDIILIASSQMLLQGIIDSLHQEFSLTDLGSLNYFLGISVTHDSSGIFLSQRKYATEILESTHMVGCNPSRTPVNTESKLGDDGDPVCLYMHDPQEPHFLALKRILLYVRGTFWIMRCKAEYRGVANDVPKTCWLRNLLRRLHTPLSSATVIYCDNVSAVYLSSNPLQHQHIFTKGLPSALFEEFCSSFSDRRPLAPTAGSVSHVYLLWA
ncbi:ribonuclease H-like domain-containing protein [Tanacetum coccineum]